MKSVRKSDSKIMFIIEKRPHQNDLKLNETNPDIFLEVNVFRTPDNIPNTFQFWNRSGFTA